MRRSLAFALLLLIAGAGMACRELASPMANLSERQPVSGTLHRADGVPVWGARIEFKPYSSVFAGQFNAVVIVEEDGNFAFEAPDIPLRAEILPPIGTGVAPRILEPIEFDPGSTRAIVLPGFTVSGRLLDPSDGLNERMQNLYFRSALDEPVLEVDFVIETTQVDQEGRFEAFCHEPGSYRLTLLQNIGNPDETWMRVVESLHVEGEDSLILTLPLVPVEIEWQMAGVPVEVDPHAEVVSIASHPDGRLMFHVHRRTKAITPSRHRLFVLPNAEHLFPLLLWGLDAHIPQVAPFGQVEPDAFVVHELGEHELLLQAEDVQGGPVEGELRVALRTVEASTWGWSRVHILRSGGALSFRLNPGEYRLVVYSWEDLYEDHEQIVLIEGDLELTVPMVPTN